MKILGTLYRGSLYCEIIKLVTGRTITCCCCVAGKPLHPINIPEYHIKIRAISHHEYPHRISSYIETQKKHGIPWEAANGEPHFSSAPEVTTAFSLLIILPSGKLTGCYGTSPFFMGKSTNFRLGHVQSSQTANVITRS